MSAPTKAALQARIEELEAHVFSLSSELELAWSIKARLKPNQRVVARPLSEAVMQAHANYRAQLSAARELAIRTRTSVVVNR